jgi:hypothetical protein
MQFAPLAFEDTCLPDLEGSPDCASNRFYAYGVIARLALLAAARELEPMAEAYEARTVAHSGVTQQPLKVAGA